MAACLAASASAVATMMAWIDLHNIWLAFLPLGTSIFGRVSSVGFFVRNFPRGLMPSEASLKIGMQLVALVLVLKYRDLTYEKLLFAEINE